MSRRFKPQRRLRNEAFPLLLVIAVPLVLAAAFPVAALHPFVSASTDVSEAHCAFVTLTPEQERQALATARTAWQLNRKAVHPTRIDLFADALPPMPPKPVLGIDARVKSVDAVSAPYAPALLPVSMAAPSPARIAPQANVGGDVPAFPREEFLKLDLP